MIYCAWLKIVDPVLNQKIRPEHLQYIDEHYRNGQILMAGPFDDGTGGMVLYHHVDWEEAQALAREDPAVKSGARQLTLKPWKLLDLPKDS